MKISSILLFLFLLCFSPAKTKFNGIIEGSGTITSTSDPDECPFGSCAYFDGRSWIEIPDFALYEWGTELTVAVRVKRDLSSNIYYHPLVSNGYVDGGGEPTFDLRTSPEEPRVVFYVLNTT